MSEGSPMQMSCKLTSTNEMVQVCWLCMCPEHDIIIPGWKEDIYILLSPCSDFHDRIRSVRVPRTGWVYRNVKQPESVSDHMYRMSMMALTITDRNINRDRCMKLALVHDMAECIVGDIAPADNISKPEKHRREEEAMKHLTGLLQDDLKKEIYELWNEYEQQSSPEARLVKELDQLEMILQAHEYEELEQTPGRLQEFFDSTQGRFHHPEVLQLVKSLNEERALHIASGSKGSSENCQSTDSQANRPADAPLP